MNVLNLILKYFLPLVLLIASGVFIYSSINAINLAPILDAKLAIYEIVNTEQPSVCIDGFSTSCFTSQSVTPRVNDSQMEINGHIINFNPESFNNYLTTQDDERVYVFLSRSLVNNQLQPLTERNIITVFQTTDASTLCLSGSYLHPYKLIGKNASDFYRYETGVSVYEVLPCRIAVDPLSKNFPYNNHLEYIAINKNEI